MGGVLVPLPESDARDCVRFGIGGRGDRHYDHLVLWGVDDIEDLKFRGGEGHCWGDGERGGGVEGNRHGGSPVREEFPAGSIPPSVPQPTPQDAPTPAALTELARHLLADAGAPVARAVIGLPGRVDYTAGHLEHAPNLPQSWVPHLSTRRLSEALGLPVALANDADLAAVGEGHAGAGRGVADLVYVTLSTGVGAGVLLGGRLVHGRRSLAEAGHMILDLAALQRGEPHTFEQLASGTALARRAAGSGLSNPEIVAGAIVGDSDCLAILAPIIDAAAAGLRNLAYLYSPALIILGGGLGLAGEVLYGPIRAHLAAFGPPHLSEPIRVVPAGLGDDAALVGASAWPTGE